MLPKRNEVQACTSCPHYTFGSIGTICMFAKNYGKSKPFGYPVNRDKSACKFSQVVIGLNLLHLGYFRLNKQQIESQGIIRTFTPHQTGEYSRESKQSKYDKFPFPNYC